MDHDRFNRMGGVRKYGYGQTGWQRAREELKTYVLKLRGLGREV